MLQINNVPLMLPAKIERQVGIFPLVLRELLGKDGVRYCAGISSVESPGGHLRRRVYRRLPVYEKGIAGTGT